MRSLSVICRHLTMVHKVVLIIMSIFALGLSYCCHQMFFSKTLAPIVTTKQGKLQGIVSTSRQGNEYLAYLGVPYAKPPIGPLRFQSPQDAESWAGVLDATYYKSPCIQVEIFITGDISGTEDCLFLNVFTPKLPKEDDVLYPVIVYIHGGLFHEGGSDRHTGKYFADENLVFVSINYRLGVFGFLNTGDGHVRGNMGLKDQSKSLKWIQENIMQFGGNPKKVTIVGESAGAACVHHHMLSPMSKGLFSGVISQSGTSLNYWAVSRTPKDQAKRFAAKFDCSTENTRSMVDCLMQMNAYEIVAAHRELLDVIYRPKISAFVPTIEILKDDEAFLTEEPLEILKSGKFNRVPWINGVNLEEGLLISSIIGANQTKMNEANNDWNKWASSVMHFVPNDDSSQKIRKYYFKDAALINSSNLVDKYTDMLGDRLFIVAATRAAKLTSQFAPTYLYVNSYRGQFSLADLMPMGDGRWPKMHIAFYFAKRFIQQYIFQKDMTTKVTSHADELCLLFPMKFLPNTQGIGQIDHDMSVDLIKLWSSFATDHTTMKFRNVSWTPLIAEEKHLKFLSISNSPAMIENPFEKRVEFWNSLTIIDQ